MIPADIYANIDPILFSFKFIYWDLVLRWYGILVMFGAVVGAWYASKEIVRRREDGEIVWDAMVWVLIFGIIGARLWYVANNILGGSNYYIEDPARILNIPEGGLHFFGGLLFGVIALYFFLKRNGKDVWLFLDALAPATLLGQALARPANFINQELYGQQTTLPWGIPIEAGHRIEGYTDLSQYPVETTRFHPTFAYEMILNFAIVGFLWNYSRKNEETIKPGQLFSMWLICAGLSRTFIEFFRPDQPRIGDTFISYTMLVSFLMAVTGVIMFLARTGKIQLAMAEGWAESYQVAKAQKPARVRQTVSPVKDDAEVSIPVKKKPVRKKPAVLKTSKPARKTVKKTAPKKQK